MTSDRRLLALLKILSIVAGLARLSSGASPDRLDALVWAVTELSQRGAWQGPRISSLWDGPLVPWRG